MRSKTTSVGAHRRLSEREKQILRYVADDLSAKQIGEKLGISKRTVEFHKRFIKKKLGVRGVAGMVRSAIRIGLIEA